LGEIKIIHTNPILQILVTKDGKYIVTSGKDKKIKVYDWNNEENIHTLRNHSSYVQTLAFSHDEKYLFSGGDDKKIVVWCTTSWIELCTLVTDFAVYKV
jgi:WD40 repeat protein